MNRKVALSLAAAALLMTGCPRGQDAKPQAAGETPRASVALRVLVVNEPGVAQAINRLSGEWAERSGGELTANSKLWNQVAASKELDADVIIFPSRYLGELCVRGWLHPVRPSVLESEQFNATDVFPLVRRQLIKWGGDVMALPLGVHVVMPAKEIDVHPALALLARAASSAVSNEREGVLFDPQTMKPRIREDAFARALQQLAEIGAEKIRNGTDFASRVPVIGFDDRLVAVTTASRNGASAFKLIAWLASAEVGAQLARAREPLLPIRQSLVSSPARQAPAHDAGDRSTPAKDTAAILSGEKCLMIPRIPGVDEYMISLDEAVKSAIFDNVQPATALRAVAERWEKITDSHGRASQRQAYLKHLGVTEP